LSLSSGARSLLLAALNAGTTIRLVDAPEDAHVAATYAGIGNFTFPNGAPTLVASVPEPSGLLLIGLGLTGVAVVSRRELLRPGRTTS
jgi:hypothetical protein